MKRTWTGFASAAAIAAVFILALAVGPGGSAFAKGKGHPGGQSSGHISEEGLQNTNGPNASDQDKGTERAEDRKNSHATDQDNGSTGKGKGKGKSKDSDE